MLTQGQSTGAYRSHQRPEKLTETGKDAPSGKYLQKRCFGDLFPLTFFFIEGRSKDPGCFLTCHATLNLFKYWGASHYQKP